MATQGVPKGSATAGTIHKVACYEQTEAAETRQVQRIAINDASFNDLTSGITQTAPTNTSVGTSAVVAVTTGAKVGWLIHNISDVDMYIGFHSTVTTSIGIRIFPGGSYEMRGLGIFLGNVYCICGSASKAVRVQTW